MTEGDATTWRDIASELRPDQIAELESFEGLGIEPEALLYIARKHAAANLDDSMEYGHIDPPPDAVRCFRWERIEGDSLSSREFWGEITQPTDTKLAVIVSGRQYDDQTCKRGVTIVCNRMEYLTAAQARDLARLLVQAADDAESVI